MKLKLIFAFAFISLYIQFAFTAPTPPAPALPFKPGIYVGTTLCQTEKGGELNINEKLNIKPDSITWENQEGKGTWQKDLRQMSFQKQGLTDFKSAKSSGTGHCLKSMCQWETKIAGVPGAEQLMIFDKSILISSVIQKGKVKWLCKGQVQLQP